MFLLAAESVLQTADGVLYLASDFIRLTFRFELRITRDFSCYFFYRALGLLRRAFNTIFIHGDCTFEEWENQG